MQRDEQMHSDKTIDERDDVNTLFPKQAVKAMTTAIERAGENREKESAVFQFEIREHKALTIGASMYLL